jgi:hypothetical protein
VKRPRWWRFGLTDEQRENLRLGLPLDFKLPYPYPRNEHEEGMNMVEVMAAAGRPVRSGRADW